VFVFSFAMADYSSDEDDEKEEMRQMFLAIDEDNSGHITKDEFIDALHNNPRVKHFVNHSDTLRKLVARKNFDDAFRKMDSDNGGEVTFDEFWRFMQTEADEKNIRRLFKAIDKDGSKRITKDELVWAVKNNPEVHEFAMKSHVLGPLIQSGNWEDAFTSMDRDAHDKDADGHGEVDIHEFFRFCKSMAVKAEVARLKLLGAKKKQKADAVGLKMKQDTLRRYTSHRSTSGIGGTYTISTWPSSYGVGL
jgi:Ca2+-binding EF-hand superfamily protein